MQISNGTISGELRRDTVEKLDGLRAQLNLHLRSQAFEHSVHFLLGVVVHESDPQEAAALFDAEPFGQIQSVVVAVPGEDALFAERRGEFKRSVAVDSYCECRAA